MYNKININSKLVGSNILHIYRFLFIYLYVFYKLFRIIVYLTYQLVFVSDKIFIGHCSLVLSIYLNSVNIVTRQYESGKLMYLTLDD